MELTLLTPPTDSPFRIPYTRGLPSESSFAVDTSALPRSLPLAAMDPSVASGPMEALARLGATGNQVSSQVLTLVLEAQAQKQRASNIVTSTEMYTKTAEAFDKEFESLKGTTTHETLRPEFDALWERVVSPVLGTAPNADVKEHLALSFAKYRLAKSAEVSDVTRAKLRDATEAGLIDSVRNDKRQALDPNATPMEVSGAIEHMKSTFLLNASGGMIPPDRLIAMQERELTATYNELARQAMTQDPRRSCRKSPTRTDRTAIARTRTAGSTPQTRSTWTPSWSARPSSRSTRRRRFDSRKSGGKRPRTRPWISRRTVGTTT